MKKNTHFFRRNQKVWAITTTGNQAAFVAGKFRGKGPRYVRGWISWKGPIDYPKFKRIEVADHFAKNLGLLTENDFGFFWGEGH